MQPQVRFEREPAFAPTSRVSNIFIYRHRAAHILDPQELHQLLDDLLDAAESRNGSIQLIQRGRALQLEASPRGGPAKFDERLAVQSFLEESRYAKSAKNAETSIHLLVVIDHHEAKILRVVFDGVTPRNIVPFDPHGFGRYLSSRNEETDGKRIPERISYYEAVASTLRGARRILLLGCVTGESSAMDQLLIELRRDHPDIAGRVIASVVVDADRLTENQMLAKAREYFSPVPG